jgi:hypothetical protein
MNGDYMRNKLWESIEGVGQPLAAPVDGADVVERRPREVIGRRVRRCQRGDLSRTPDGGRGIADLPRGGVPLAEALDGAHLGHDVGAVLASPRVQRHERRNFTAIDDKILRGNAMGAIPAARPTPDIRAPHSLTRSTVRVGRDNQVISGQPKEEQR